MYWGYIGVLLELNWGSIGLYIGVILGILEFSRMKLRTALFASLACSTALRQQFGDTMNNLGQHHMNSNGIQVHALGFGEYIDHSAYSESTQVLVRMLPSGLILLTQTLVQRISMQAPIGNDTLASLTADHVAQS